MPNEHYKTTAPGVWVIADATTDRILGEHLLGPSVGEMVGEYAVAMEFGASSEDVARTSHPHPTRSEALRQAAMGVEGWTMQADEEPSLSREFPKVGREEDLSRTCSEVGR